MFKGTHSWFSQHFPHSLRQGHHSQTPAQSMYLNYFYGILFFSEVSEINNEASHGECDALSLS